MSNKRKLYCKHCDEQVEISNICGYILCNVCGSELGIVGVDLPHIAKKNKKVCKGCGTLTKTTIHGYCNIMCFRRHELSKYISKGYVFPFNEIPRILFNRYGLIYEPVCEDEVIFLFAKIHKLIGFNYVTIFRQGYPDCTAINKKGFNIRIEFEYCSSRFEIHDPNGCDLVVCWEHDWKECPVKVISLKDFILKTHHSKIKTLLDYF